MFAKRTAIFATSESGTKNASTPPTISRKEITPFRIILVRK